MLLSAYAVYGTGLAYAAVCLRACYAMSSTDLRRCYAVSGDCYSATRCPVLCYSATPCPVLCYSATRCPVLCYSATRCPVLASRTPAMLPCYAMSGTGVVHAATVLRDARYWHTPYGFVT
eukprot:908012-Rhodomonas_salina.1